MFFFWFAKNKPFKKKSNVSGQIVPFLLVALVVLLIAAIATINIGRVSLDKTCSANAADACSLAAGSAWASAFNVLTGINRDQIEYWYDLKWFTYQLLYAEADKYLDKAMLEAGFASAFAIVGARATDTSPRCVEIWWAGIAAFVADAMASLRAFEASFWTQAFNLTLLTMQSETDSFYEQQRINYCQARSFMDDAYINARKTGLSYAFNNSCIPAKLSDTQSDTFSAWMAAEGPYNEGTFSWQDKIDQSHTVTTTLGLPNITSYELQHTQGSYSQIKNLLNDLIQRSQIIVTALNSTAVILGTTATEFFFAVMTSLTAFTLYVTCCNVPWPVCCPAWAGVCTALQNTYVTLKVKQTIWTDYLAAIVGAAAAISLFLLQSDNDKAYDYWKTDGNQSSVSCADTEDLMIVKINDVILTKDASWPGNDWTTLCTTTQQHPTVSTGTLILDTQYPQDGIISSSRAKFDAGHGNTPEGGGIDVGLFNDVYDASIVDTK